MLYWSGASHYYNYRKLEGDDVNKQTILIHPVVKHKVMEIPNSHNSDGVQIRNTC